MNCIILAASLVRFLDPWTQAVQTDEPGKGLDMSFEQGYWAVPCGLVDPLANKPSPRVIHTCFRVSDERFPDWDENKPSPLFKVNQVGYLPDRPKYAYAGAWLGPRIGAWKPKAPLAGWELVDAASGRAVLKREGPGEPKVRVPDSVSKEGIPFTGEETYEMDFSEVKDEGVYFVRIPGVGRSADFRISSDAAIEAFRVHMSGLYHKRCGIEKSPRRTRWPSGACHLEAVRGRFPPEEGKLEPKVKWFEIIRDSTDWNGERVKVAGGWHDAADYDRRPWHLNIVNDLCAVYLMRPGNFCDGQLSIPESENGIPDILDEAEWGLRHLLAVQNRDGGVGTWIETTGHPGPGNVAERDPMPYAISRATRRSSIMYAAHAALLARCHPSFKEKHLASALRAWDFATGTRPQTDTFEVRDRNGGMKRVAWTEDRDLPAAYLLKAAVNLHALTGETRFLELPLASKKSVCDAFAKEGWKLPPLLFAGERELGIPFEMNAFFKQWEKSKVNTAKGILGQMDDAYAYRAPWWRAKEGWVHAMGFGHSHPLVRAQYLVAAHQITGEERYLDAISVAMDFHNGCNPQGTTLTSGLGETYPVAFLDLPSYVDGIAEPVGGITPYRWTYILPRKAVEAVWHSNRHVASKWPIWRRWGNLEALTPAASEYTVWETIAPAASVTGYMISSAKTPPAAAREPAKDIRELPGYWLLP